MKFNASIVADILEEEKGTLDTLEHLLKQKDEKPLYYRLFLRPIVEPMALMYFHCLVNKLYETQSDREKKGPVEVAKIFTEKFCFPCQKKIGFTYNKCQNCSWKSTLERIQNLEEDLNV